MRLLAKELRQLSPIALLWFALLVVGYVLQLVAGRVDEESFGSWYEEVLGPGTDFGVAVLSAIIVLVTAWSLFPREHDDSTIDFLRALPVSRARVFAAKIAAAMLLLAAVIGTGYALDAALLAGNPESFGGRFYAQAWTTLLWRDLAFAFVVLCHGVLLSWFRTVGLVVFALYLVSVMLLESSTGSAGLYSVLGMLSNEYDGSRLVVDARAIAVHVAVACVSLFLAWRLWSRTPSAATGGRADPKSAGRRRTALAVLGLVALGGVLLSRVSPSARFDTEGVAAVAFAVTSTEHYRFAYDPEDADTVAYLETRADADFEHVGRLLGLAADELPRVRVDLAAQSEHAAGLATWKTIRMDLDTFDADETQARVLAHESVHVLQSVLSRRALARHFAAARFFVEGMAQHVSFDVVPEPGRRRSNHDIAAVAWQRLDIRFEDLIDAEFASSFDPDLYYSLGDLWAEAFVQSCGPGSFGDFLRAAGRDEVPRLLAPLTFWRDTLREIDCGLEDVNERYRSIMQARYDALDPADFPTFEDVSVERLADGRVRLSASVVPADVAGEGTDGDAVDGAAGRAAGGTARGAAREAARGTARGAASRTATANVRERLPARFVVRIGAEAGIVAAVDPVYRGRVVPPADGAGNDAANGTGDDVVRVSWDVPARSVPRTRFDYQLGYAPFDDSRVLYERRRSASAPPN